MALGGAQEQHRVDLGDVEAFVEQCLVAENRGEEDPAADWIAGGSRVPFAFDVAGVEVLRYLRDTLGSFRGRLWYGRPL